MISPKLGNFIAGSDAARDAIHLAIAPVSCPERVSPGQRVRLVSTTIVVPCATDDEAIGIVDPFLNHSPYPGELFWLCLTPGEITGIRHYWIHPAFDDGVRLIEDADDFLIKIFCKRYNIAREKLIADWKFGDRIVAHGMDLCDGDSDVQQMRGILKRVTGCSGEKVTFTCAC